MMMCRLCAMSIEAFAKGVIRILARLVLAFILTILIADFIDRHYFMGDKPMTPCEEKGYEEGQIFEDKRDGELYVLVHDDGTYQPNFFSITRRDPNRFPPISKLTRIFPPEDSVVTVVCEGTKTTISRESAIALNLIKG